MSLVEAGIYVSRSGRAFPRAVRRRRHGGVRGSTVPPLATRLDTARAPATLSTRKISLTLVGACAAEHRQVPAVVTHWSGTVGAVTLQHRAVERVFPVASPLHSRVMPSGDLSCALAMRCRGEAGSRASVPTVPLVRLPLTGPRHPLVHQEHWLTPDPRICQTRRTANCGRHTCRIGLT